MADGIHFDQEGLLAEMDDLKIKMALISYMELEGKSLAEENKQLRQDDLYRLDDETKRQFRKRIGRAYHKRHAWSSLRSGGRIIGKAAAVILILLISVAIPVLSVEAVRVKVFNFVLDMEDKYTSLTLEPADGENDADLQAGRKDVYKPTRIPEGYELSDKSGKAIRILQYTNAEGGRIIFQQSGYGSTTNIDTENAEVSKVTVQGTEGMFVVKGDVVMVTWSNGTYIFLITIFQGDFSQEEVLDIAESVSLVK